MKINEQLASITQPPIPQNAPNKQAFDQWIDSGDAYYKQHQAQLEQSSLHFDFQPMPKKPQKSVTLNKPISQQDPPTSPDANTFVPASQHTLTERFQHTKISHFDNPLTAEIVPLRDSSFNLTFADAKDPISQCKIEKNEAVKNSSPSQPFTPLQLKNHHVFIEEQQAEVTLNSEGLSTKDKKELIQMLKQHLKNKDLILNQLIINGVPHD